MCVALQVDFVQLIEDRRRMLPLEITDDIGFVLHVQDAMMNRASVGFLCIFSIPAIFLSQIPLSHTYYTVRHYYK